MKAILRGIFARAGRPRPAVSLCLAVLCCLWAHPRTGLAAPQTRARARGKQQSTARRPPAPLVVIGPRGRLSLDGRPAGTVRRPSELTKALTALFQRREGQNTPRFAGAHQADGFSHDVIIMASPSARYSDIEVVIRAVAQAGAAPVKLVRNAAQLREARRELSASLAPPPKSSVPETDAATPELRDPSTDPSIIRESSIVVAIAPDNSLRLNRREVPLAQLEGAVRELTDGLQETDKIVYVRAHLDAPYHLVIEVIEAIRKAGVVQIGLVAEKQEQP